MVTSFGVKSSAKFGFRTGRSFIRVCFGSRRWGHLGGERRRLFQGRVDARRTGRHRGPYQTHAASNALTASLLADQLDAGGPKRLDDLDQRADHAAHIALARFHPLNGR